MRATSRLVIPPGNGRRGRTGGAAVWSPASLPGLAPSLSVALQRTLGLLWQDSGKTIAATADGDPVRVATCPWTGEDYTASSDASRPLLWEEGGGKWSLYFDGIDDMLLGTASPVGATTIAVRYTDLASGGGVRLLSTPLANTLVHPRRIDGYPFFVGATVYATPWADDTGTHTAVFRKAGGGGFWTLRSDGSDLSVSASSSTDWPSVSLGNTFASETFEGRVTALVVAATNAAGGDLDNLESYLSALL